MSKKDVFLDLGDPDDVKVLEAIEEEVEKEIKNEGKKKENVD